MSGGAAHGSTVVQVVQHLRPGGIETLVLELARLAPAGEQVWIVSLEGNRDQAVAAWPRLELVAERLIFLDKHPGWRPDVAVKLWRLFRRLAPQAVQTHHIGPLIYAATAARLAGVPYRIHTEHDAWHLEDAQRLRLQRTFLTLARPRLVADAEHVAEAVRGRLPGVEVAVIRNGIDSEHFVACERAAARARLALPEDVRLVGCAARLTAVKGHRFLIEALSRLPEDIHLALAGQGEEEAALRALVDTTGLAGRVHWLSNLDDMPGFYSALDLFCLPSLAEGMPLSPLEAQSCGVPVVVTDVGGSREAVDPDSGRLVPSADAGAIAVAIEAVLAGAAGRGPREFVREHGDIRAMLRAYADLRR